MDIDLLSINGADIQREFGFWLKWRELSAPVPKTNYIEIPGRDGELDLSEALGDIFYSNRILQMSMINPDDDWHDNYMQFVSMFHGKQCQFVFENDPDWYWTGRLTVDGYSAKSHTMSMSASVYPFKMAVVETAVNKTLSSVTEENAVTIKLSNGRMKVTPTVLIDDGEIHMRWGDHTATLSDGTYHVSGFTLGEGITDVELWGSGTITIRYRVGML